MCEDNFIDEFNVEVDSYCVANDIDDYDLFGEIMVGDNESDNCCTDIIFE